LEKHYFPASTQVVEANPGRMNRCLPIQFLRLNNRGQCCNRSGRIAKPETSAKADCKARTPPASWLAQKKLAARHIGSGMRIAKMIVVMKKTFLLLFSALAGGALAVGCNRTDENANGKSSAQAPAAYNYAYDKKDVYLANASNDLAALNGKIDELADQAAMAGDKYKTNAEPKIQALRNQRIVLYQKLAALRQASESSWNTAKNDYMNAYRDTKTSCQQAWQWLKDKSGS